MFGAGDGAEQVITAMLRDPDSPYLPVAIVDDDPRKRHLRVRNVRVRGTRHDIPRLAAETAAEVLLIAVPSADGPLVRELAALGEGAGLKVLAVPAVRDLFDDRIGLEDIRPLTNADLLGRREIDTDIAAHRRLPHRPAGAGHRRRRVDRLGAVPPGPRLRARRRW